MVFDNSNFRSMEQLPNRGISTPFGNSSKRLGLRHRKLTQCLSDSPAYKKAKILSVTNAAAQNSSVTGDSSPVAWPTTTPKQIEITRKSLSTGQSKLSLCQRTREKFRKKRLNFNSASAEVCQEANSTNERHVPRPDLDTCESAANPERIGIDYDNHSASSNSENEHELKIKHLKETIEVWKSGFNRAVRDLCEKLNTSEDELFAQLNIPSEMSNYLIKD